MKRTLIALLVLVFAPLAFSVPQATTTRSPLGEEDGASQGRFDAIERARLEKNLRDQGSTAYSEEGTSPLLWEATFSQGCESSFGDLEVTRLPQENILHFVVTNTNSSRMGAIFAGVPAQATPLGGPGSNLCAGQSTLFHFVPEKTTAQGTFTSDQHFLLPGDLPGTFAFQFWCRDPDQSWSFGLSDAVNVEFTFPDPNLDLDPPGTLVHDVTSTLRATTFEVAETEGVIYDNTTQILTLTNPAQDYNVGEVLLLDFEGERYALKVTGIIGQSSTDIAFDVVRAAAHEVFTPGTINYRYTPDFSQLGSGAMQSLSAGANFFSIEPDGTIHLEDFSIFELFVNLDGTIDYSQSTLMGIALGQGNNGIVDADVSDCAGGSLQARIVSGNIRVIPTFIMNEEVGNTYTSIHGSADVHVEYDFEIELKATGSSSLGIDWPLLTLPPFAAPVGPLVVTVTLALPAGFEFESSGDASITLHYKTDYNHHMTVNYNYLTDPWPQFTSEVFPGQYETEKGLSVTSDAGLDIAGTLFLEPKVSVELYGLFGPFVWLKPYIQGRVQFPLLPNEHELFVGIEAGLGIDVGRLSLPSPDLLGIDPLSWDLVGPQDGGGDPNTPPMAHDGWMTSNSWGTTITLTGSDNEQSTLFYSLESAPQNGTLGTLNTLTGEVFYTPHANFTGVDTFTFSVFDGYVTSNTATITVAVQDAPNGQGAPSGTVLVPGGYFAMGRHVGSGNSDELPVHPVVVDAFYMDIFEVSNSKYAAYLNTAYAEGRVTVSSGRVYQVGGAGQVLCDTTAYDDDSRIAWNGSTFEVTAGKEDHPMVEVSWYGACAYANGRSRAAGLTPAYNETTWACNFNADGFRLPTEAEREYAARGGEHSPYYMYPWGNTLDGSKANYWNSGDPYENGGYPWTTPVGYYDANGYGLYDMAGNVWEWCNDWYSSSYYSSSPVNNPTGPDSGSSRVIRGGSWNNSPSNLRSAYRNGSIPSYRYYNVGFRVLAVRP